MEYPVSLPNIFQTPGQALQSGAEQLQRQGENLAQLQLRQQEMALRKAERDQAEMFRKTQLIQEMTDLSKYQTANDVANALGNQKAIDVQKKWFNLINSNKVDLASLAQGITKDINNITQGMNALKTEHDQVDKGIQILKQQYPDLNIPKLIKDYRQDVIERRIENGDFKNPLEVNQSEFVNRLADPRFLSTYKMSNKALREAIVNPKGVEEVKVFTGTPVENMRYEAKVPFWKKPSYAPEQVVGGFLPKGVQPTLEMRATQLPAEALPAAKGKFNIVDEDVYRTFAQDQNSYMDLINATRAKYPQYDTFSPQEQQYAERNALYDQLKSLDQTNFIPAQSTRAPIDRGERPTESEKRSEIIGNYLDAFSSAVKAGDEADIKNLANKFYGLKGGKANYDGVQVYKRPDGTVTGFQIKYKNDKGQRVISDVVAVNDPNLEDKLQGIYQKISGSETAAEISNLKDLNAPKPETKAPVKLNLINGKLPEDQFKKLVKGQLYNVNGKSYLWNGEKFQPK